jgi:hypothetical protein
MPAPSDSGDADIEVPAGGLTATTHTATTSVRHNLAIQHLMGAALFARNTHAIEELHRGESIEPYFNQIMWQVTACVMMAVAAVEAHFNERMADLKVDNEFLKLIDRKGPIERHARVLQFRGGAVLDLGAAPTQPFSDLVLLRNALVHFSPEWDTDQVRHAELHTSLKGKFTTSPFVGPNDVFFPKRCMSHGCAAWAVRSARDFGDKFADLLGVKPRFRPLGDLLATMAPAEGRCTQRAVGSSGAKARWMGWILRRRRSVSAGEPLWLFDLGNGRDRRLLRPGAMASD